MFFSLRDVVGNSVAYFCGICKREIARIRYAPRHGRAETKGDFLRLLHGFPLTKRKDMVKMITVLERPEKGFKK